MNLTFEWYNKFNTQNVQLHEFTTCSVATHRQLVFMMFMYYTEYLSIYQ